MFEDSAENQIQVKAITNSTKLSEIKELPDRFVLSRGEGGEIDDALSWLDFFQDNLERGQSSGITGKLGIVPDQPLNGLKFKGRENGERVQTANTERSEWKNTSEAEQSRYIFPTDIVSIIAGIIEILRDREKFSLSEFAGYYREPSESSVWIRNWASNKLGLISELELLKNSHKVIALIKTVRLALVEYKNNHQRPPAGYDRVLKTKEKILDNIIPEIVNQAKPFVEANNAVDFSDKKRDQVVSFLSKLLLSGGDVAEKLFDFFIGDQHSQDLQNAQHSGGRTIEFKFPGEKETYYVEDFIETRWFLNRRSEAISWFINKYKDELTDILAVPQSDSDDLDLDIDSNSLKKKEDESSQSEFADDDLEKTKEEKEKPPELTQAKVPPLDQFQKPAEPREITTDFRSRVRYETTWISNRALYELFATNGIDLATIDPSLINLVQNETLQMLAGYSDAEIARLFASPSERQRAVFYLFSRLNASPIYINAVNTVYVANNLSQISQLQFKPERSAKDVLVEQLKKLSQSAGQETQINDSAIANVVSRLDTMILSYGLNELLPPDQQTSHRDAVWFIQNLDPQKLAIIFFPQLDPQFASRIVEQYQQLLKTLLINYVRIRAFQLVLETNNTNTGKGLLDGVSEDDQKALLGDRAGFIKHFSPNSHPTGDVQEFANEKGADLAAKAFVYNPRGSKAQEKIEKIYQTFIPIWESLDLETQRRIYLSFGLKPGDRYVDAGSKLPFLFEFVFLSKEDIELLVNPPEIDGRENYVISFDEYQRYTAQEAKQQLIALREAEDYGRMLQAYYLSEMDAEAREKAISDSGVSDPSFQDLYQTDATSSGGRKSFIDRLPFSDRIKDVFKKSAKKKLKEALGKKALESTATKWNPWLSLLSMMRTEEGRKRLGILGGALALAIARALYNMLHSVGGFVGGLAGIGAGIAIGTAIGGPIGAFVGLVSGVGLALLGSEVGSQLLPSSLGFGGSQTGFATGTTTATYTSSVSGTGVQARPISATGSTVAGSQPPPGSESVLARTGNIITNLPVGILAPSLMILITIISTLTVLNVIRNAFLVSAPLGGALSEAAAAQFFACKNSSIPKPTTANRITVGDYTFPVDAGFAPENGGGGLSCTHWDHDLVTDIFSGAATTEPQKNLPVLAYTSGTIYMVVTDDSLGGLYLILKGDDNRWYYYAHNCAIYVQPGQTVSNGEIIAVTNQTGLNAAVTPEHLHFSIQEGGNEPNFFNGGNVCPTEDFAEKFPGTPADRCSVAEQCTPG